MKNRLILILSILFIFSTSAYALAPQIALRSEFGIRPLGMGGAFTAVADDANACFYNPAGLDNDGFQYSTGNLDNNKLAYSESRFDLLRMGSLAYANYNLGISNETTHINTYSLGYRSAYGLSWGLTYKNMRWNVGAGDLSDWSSDFGLLFRVTPWMNIGLLGQEIASGNNFPVGSSTRLGLALWPIGKKMVFAADLELDSSRQNQNLTHFGLELKTIKGLSLRAGFDQGRPTAGASFDVLFFKLDYAYLLDNNSNAIHRIGGTMQFYPEEERSYSFMKPKEFALIDVRGSLRGGESEASFLGGYRFGVDRIIYQIDKASRDPEIDGIFLRIGGFEGGLGGTAMVQEIREALSKAKDKGKKIVAYVENGALGDEYYLVSIADKIIAPSGSSIGGLGKMIGITRLKGLYKKIGVEWEVLTQGEYKNTFDPFSEGLTKPQKQMIKGIISDLYRQMITDIAQSRKIKLSLVKDLGDARLLTAREAKQMGLIDEIGYLKDATKIAGQMCGSDDEVKLISPNNIRVRTPETFLISVFNRVAVIEIDGEIVTGTSGENIIFGGKYIGADTITEQIRKAADDGQIKAIIIRINSGGGSPVASGQIYQEIKRARSKGKKVIASIGDVTASGGYFIACSADKIVADPASITGSIGVIGRLRVIKDFYEKFGVKVEIIKEGKYADMFSGLEKLSDEEKASLNRLQKEIYDEFIAKVAEGRNMSTSEVESLAGGRIYTGAQAKELGLVDELGGFEYAINMASDLTGIKGEPELIYYYRQSPWIGIGKNLIQTLGLQNSSTSNYKIY